MTAPWSQLQSQLDQAQERNAESLLIIHNKALAADYTTNWQTQATDAGPYVSRGVAR